MTPTQSLVVHGVTPSYFTRKITGYLDYKGLRWWMRPSIGVNQRAMVAGWNGGIPVVELPEGELVWDSTSVIAHLETIHPAPAVHPEHPVLRFLDFVLDDFSDEWFYRHAVGSRWSFEENAEVGALDIGREAAFELGASLDQARAAVTYSMKECLPRLGVTPANVDAWLQDSLFPWQRALDEHLRAHPFVFGARPSLADFAVYGGNAAHFTRDPLCRSWTEEQAPEVVAHTYRLDMPDGQAFGEWFDGDAVPDTLVAVLAEAGRHYLPWVATATVDGAATVAFDSGATAEIRATEFLRQARGIMLARYVEARSPALDAVLEEAGILRWYADFTPQATTVPDAAVAPRPTQNRPYPAGPGAATVP